MVMTTISTPVTHRVVVVISYPPQHHNNNRPTKLNGGPGNIGITAPNKPTSTITKAIIAKNNSIESFFNET
jgi:hypothetical protein